MHTRAQLARKAFQNIGIFLSDYGRYSSSAKIYESTMSRTASGQLQPIRTVRSGLNGVPVSLAPMSPSSPSGSSEKRTGFVTFEKDMLHASFPAYYPEIQKTDIAEIDGVQYNIMGVEHSSEQLYTRLALERIGITNGEQTTKV